MPKMRLNRRQKLALLDGLSVTTKNRCKTICHREQMHGAGIKDILKKIGSVLGPIAREVGPVVLKQWLIPFLKRKFAGEGLKLAGTGIKKKRRKRKIYY